MISDNPISDNPIPNHLIHGQPLSSSKDFSSGGLHGSNMKHVCQLQVEQLVTQLQISAGWITYYDSDSDRHHAVRHSQAQFRWDTPTLSYLESETWWSDFLPILRLSKLAIDGINVYVLPLSHRKFDYEYLLLCSEEPLSMLQQQVTEQQGRLLNHYLGTYQECSRQQEKVRLLEQAVQRVEHQLRNPLALVGLYADLCLQSPHCWQEHAELIRQTVARMSANLSALVHCGYQAKLLVAPHDLQSILIESIDGLQTWLDEKQLKVYYSSTPVTLAVDRLQLKQVFDNLLSNAMHFSPPNETITCQWQVFHHEVLIEVRDRGPGLSEVDLQKIFTPFYSRRPGGTGLGLAIAKKIVLDHHGSFWAQNLPQGGAQFSFTLPR